METLRMHEYDILLLRVGQGAGPHDFVFLICALRKGPKRQSLVKSLFELYLSRCVNSQVSHLAAYLNRIGLFTIKFLLNSVVSTPGAKFMTLDIKNFYLNTPIK